MSDQSTDDSDGTAVMPNDRQEAETELDAVFEELWATIQERKRSLPEDSYTASLLTHEKGDDAVLEKLGEETTELVLAAKNDDRERIAAESADLVYHLLVLLASRDMDPDELRTELHERF